MKTGILALLFFSIVSSPIAGGGAKGDIKYGTYVNPRFEFSVKYPKQLLFPQPPPENGDGRTYLSKDRKVKLLAWGQNNAFPHTWGEQFEYILKFESEGKDAQITYKSFKKDSFVISGYRGGNIFYRRDLSVENNEVFLTFMIEYPKKDKKFWDEVVKTCAASLKRTDGAD